MARVNNQRSANGPLQNAPRGATPRSGAGITAAHLPARQHLASHFKLETFAATLARPHFAVAIGIAGQARCGAAGVAQRRALLGDVKHRQRPVAALVQSNRDFVAQALYSWVIA